MLDLTRLPEMVRHEQGVSRRLFLAYAASLDERAVVGQKCQSSDAAAAVLGRSVQRRRGIGRSQHQAAWCFGRDWHPAAGTRRRPGTGAIEVAWEIATDDGMRNVVRRGTSIATPQLGHSVHVEVDGLEPDRWYWYRFRSGDAESPIGRTRTMPANDSSPAELRFAFASCQNYEAGLYTAYEHMAKEELDLVFHLGDYIYEYKGEDGRVRKHVGKEIESLDDYRIRHAQYKSDPLLQAMHARCPWMVVWDDHEFDNNCANDISEEEGVDPADFLDSPCECVPGVLRDDAAAATSLPRGPHMQLYRKLSFGRLAEFLMLDTRQYRTDQPNGDGDHDINDDAMSPKARCSAAGNGAGCRSR